MYCVGIGRWRLCMSSAVYSTWAHWAVNCTRCVAGRHLARARALWRSTTRSLTRGATVVIWTTSHMSMQVRWLQLTSVWQPMRTCTMAIRLIAYICLRAASHMSFIAYVNPFFCQVALTLVRSTFPVATRDQIKVTWTTYGAMTSQMMHGLTLNPWRLWVLLVNFWFVMILDFS